MLRSPKAGEGHRGRFHAVSRTSRNGNLVIRTCTDANMANKITQALHWDGYSTSYQQLNNIPANLGLAGFRRRAARCRKQQFSAVEDGAA